jgi:hypothetical protein
MPARISHVEVTAKTGNDDKECGVFSVRLFQGALRFCELEYGDNEDWNEGFTLQEGEDLAGAPFVNGKPIRCEVALEERPGQVNITWDARVKVEIFDDTGRKITFSKQIRFDTDHHKPEHRRLLGSGTFAS